MRVVKFLFLIFILVLLPAYSNSFTLGDLRVSLIEGDVQILTEDMEDWVPASINMPLRDGDRIWVPEGGKTEIQTRDGTLLRLDEESALEILNIEKDMSQFYLTEGRLYASFRGLKGSLLQVDTPVSSLRAYDRSIFSVDVMREGATDISVYRGSVDAESEEGRTTVDEGKVLSVGEGHYAEIGSLGPPDEWEGWNQERDRRLARRPPSRYLPEELYPYSSDFEENGRWVHVREYGYVWTPTVVVSAGWAPYRVGRWVWIGGDYVWISYEPWGWVPYHYGRWAYVSPVGWCRVPPPRGSVYWGPGYVGWVYTPTHVSWVPLAPREIYYGHGHYGPHSVNITRVHINRIHIEKTVYKNVRARNAVTVIHRDTFVTGRHVDVHTRENPFLRGKISVGRPDIKPQRTTMIPVIKEIPQTRQPPRQIKEIRVKEIKVKRPIVREREASVLRPGSPLRKMDVRIREGRPVERRFERPSERRSIEKEVEKPREGSPVRGSVEKLEDRKPEDRKIEDRKIEDRKIEDRKVEDPKPRDRGLEKPTERRPVEKEGLKHREPKPVDKEVGKPPERQSVDREGKSPRERRTVERRVEQPKGKVETPKVIEKPPRDSKHEERVSEKPREDSPGVKEGRRERE